MSLLEGMDRQQEGEPGSLQPYEVLRRAKHSQKAAGAADAAHVRRPCMRVVLPCRSGHPLQQVDC